MSTVTKDTGFASVDVTKALVELEAKINDLSAKVDLQDSEIRSLKMTLDGKPGHKQQLPTYETRKSVDDRRHATERSQNRDSLLTEGEQLVAKYYDDVDFAESGFKRQEESLAKMYKVQNEALEKDCKEKRERLERDYREMWERLKNGGKS